MKTIGIPVEIRILDDPELCANGAERCSELYRIDWIYWCHRYARHGMDKPKLQQHDEFFNYPVKCDQCKESYQDAKTSELHQCPCGPAKCKMDEPCFDCAAYINWNYQLVRS